MILEGYTRLSVAAWQVRRRIRERLADLIGGDMGATAAEYAVLIALIAAVIFAGATVLGQNVNTKLNEAGTQIGSAS